MSLYDYAKSQNQNEILIFLENVESYQVTLHFTIYQWLDFGFYDFLF